MNNKKIRGHEKKFMLDFTLEFHTQIKRAAMAKGVSMHIFILRAIQYYLTIIGESKHGKV